MNNKIRLYTTILLLLITGLLFNYINNTDNLLEEASAVIVCNIHQLFGVNCYTIKNVIIYDDVKTIISNACLGIDLVIIFLIMVWGLGLINKKKILIYSLSLALFNTLRILLFYPVKTIIGFEATSKIHNIMYSYINGLLLILLFIIYAVSEINKNKKNTKEKNIIK